MRTLGSGTAQGWCTCTAESAQLKEKAVHELQYFAQQKLKIEYCDNCGLSPTKRKLFL
jgi:hypothetical protein